MLTGLPVWVVEQRDQDRQQRVIREASAEERGEACDAGQHGALHITARVPENELHAGAFSNKISRELRKRLQRAHVLVSLMTFFVAPTPKPAALGASTIVGREGSTAVEPRMTFARNL